MAKMDPMLIVAAVVIVALVMAPQLFAGFGDVISRGWDSWQNMFGQGGTGGAYCALEIEYADGRIELYEPDPDALLPLSVSDAGGEVTQVTLKPRCVLEYEGTVQSWTIDSLFVVNLKTDAGSTVVGQFRSWVIEKEGTSWGSKTRELASEAIAASELERALLTHGSGTYRLNGIFDLTIVVTFTDGTSETKGTSAVPLNWQFTYATGEPPTEPMQITSLSVDIAMYKLR